MATHLETTATTGPMGGSWLRDFDPVMQIVFELYEEDFGSTRRTLHALNDEDPRIPYLRLLTMHALFELEGAGADIARHRRATGAGHPALVRRGSTACDLGRGQARCRSHAQSSGRHDEHGDRHVRLDRPRAPNGFRTHLSGRGSTPGPRGRLRDARPFAPRRCSAHELGSESALRSSRGWTPAISGRPSNSPRRDAAANALAERRGSRGVLRRARTTALAGLGCVCRCPGRRSGFVSDHVLRFPDLDGRLPLTERARSRAPRQERAGADAHDPDWARTSCFGSRCWART